MPDGPKSTLIETVRVRDGAAPLWYLHIRRLVASCRTLGVPFPGAFVVPGGGADRVQRLEVGPKGVAKSEREVGPTTPVRLVISGVPHPGYRHKTTERVAFERAAQEARQAGADDALLLTPRGEVAEATIWCVFWWEGETLAAPALELGILPGVSRMRIAEIQGAIAERRVSPEALKGRSLFLANAARGIVQVSALNGVSVPADARTQALLARFWP